MTVQAPQPGRVQGNAPRRTGDGDGLARAGVVLGIASLPILQPAFANNLAARLTTSPITV